MNAYESLPESSPAIERIAALAARTLPGPDADSGRQLYRLMRDDAPTAVAVDVGSASAAIALWLAAAIRDRAGGRVYAFADWSDALRERCIEDLRAAAVDDCIELRAADLVQAGQGWNGVEPIGLLHLAGAGSAMDWRDRFEAWSRFVAVGGFLVLDGAGSLPAPSQLAMNLPRWWRWSGSCRNKWIFVRSDEPYPTRRSYGVDA